MFNVSQFLVRDSAWPFRHGEELVLEIVGDHIEIKREAK